MKISFESIPHNVNDKKKREHDVKKFLKTIYQKELAQGMIKRSENPKPNRAHTHDIKKKIIQIFHCYSRVLF